MQRLAQRQHANLVADRRHHPIHRRQSFGRHERKLNRLSRKPLVERNKFWNVASVGHDPPLSVQSSTTNIFSNHSLDCRFLTPSTRQLCRSPTAPAAHLLHGSSA